jgi:Uma2 family endonuclease
MTVDLRPFDPDEEEDLPEPPRAPSQADWDAMSDEARARTLDALPDDIPWEEIGMPEGDPHFDAKNDTRDVLKNFFSRLGRHVYIAADLAVYYPDERRFSPDVLAVFDVDPYTRMKWVVSAERKGLDFVLEVVVAGKRRKDTVANRHRYARLGIPEYFVYDHRRATVQGWRLSSSLMRTYAPIASSGGMLHSEVLGLDVAVLERRLRFFYANAELRPSSELLDVLEARIDDLNGAIEVEQLRTEEERVRAEEERARAEAAEARVRALEAELERLRRGG